MRKHWQYLKYVLRHKSFVMLSGLQLGVPLWRLIIHDWPKFSWAEWKPYVDSFYGPWSYMDRPPDVVEAFDKAWLHHIHKCPHHWQYWILREDDGDTKALEMPETYAREMLADWLGAGRAITGRNNFIEWYGKNRDIIILHPSTRAYVETLARRKGILPLVTT